MALCYDYKAKERNVRVANDYMFAKTLSMFEWQDLPETIPYKELEKLLQRNGYAFITKVEGELYAFSGGVGGETDVYGNPTTITIASPALKFNKTLDIKKDGVLIINDDSEMGLLPILNKFNTLMVENEINMVVSGYNARIGTMISASDDKTKASADLFLTKIVKGDMAVIGEQAMFDGVKSHQASRQVPITDMIEFHQYMKASLFNEIGLNANFNMKRERLNSAEVLQNEDTIYPFVDNMMKCRLKGVEKLNEMYDLKVDIDYGSVWGDKRRSRVDDVVVLDEGTKPVDTDRNVIVDPLPTDPTVPGAIPNDATQRNSDVPGTGGDNPTQAAAGTPAAADATDPKEPPAVPPVATVKEEANEPGVQDPAADPVEPGAGPDPQEEVILVEDEATAWDLAILEDQAHTAAKE